MFRWLNSSLFDNVGKKLKRVIRWFVYFVFGLLLLLGTSVIWFTIQRFNAGYTKAIYVAAMIPFVVVLLGFLVWLFAAALYGFAELIDTAVTNRQGGENEDLPEDFFIPEDEDEFEEEEEATGDEMWFCPHCEGEVSFSQETQTWRCANCQRQYQVVGKGWLQRLKEL